MTKEEFLKKAHAIYGDKYCYERTILGGHLDKIRVTCKEHGDWYPVEKTFLVGMDAQNAQKKPLQVNKRRVSSDLSKMLAKSMEINMIIRKLSTKMR